MAIFQAVLFDCDGVLVDSEPITNGVLHTMLVERGWNLSAQVCWDLFVGHTVRSRRDLIEQHTGQPWSEEWLTEFMQRRNLALQSDLQLIEGVREAVAHVHRHSGGRLAVASGADRFKVEMMLDQFGLLDYFQGRVFSGHEMPRSKPHPHCMRGRSTPTSTPSRPNASSRSTPWFAPPARALSRSQSANTMLGDLPPNSSDTRFMDLAACA